jgi:hypothetical protein
MLIFQLTQSLMNPMTSARNAALQSFAQDAAGNADAIALASRVPQAIGTGFGYTILDLRAIQNRQWASAAPMEAALIYFVRRVSVQMLRLGNFRFLPGAFPRYGQDEIGSAQKVKILEHVGAATRLGAYCILFHRKPDS